MTNRLCGAPSVGLFLGRFLPLLSFGVKIWHKVRFSFVTKNIFYKNLLFKQILTLAKVTWKKNDPKMIQNEARTNDIAKFNKSKLNILLQFSNLGS